MKTIISELHYQAEKKQDAVLVTIVGEQGSAPRGTGSMMLVGKKGRLVGTIGGGAVEENSVRMAQEVLEKKESLLHEFVLRRNDKEDIGMVCGGNVTVYFRYIAAEDALWQAIAAEAEKRFAAHEAGWLVQNLVSGEASLVDAEGEAVVGKAVPKEALQVGYNGLRVGDYFAMPLPLGERAIIFGAGHIARALVPILRSVGFRPIVFDCRAEYADAAAFPAAEQVICGDYLRIADYLSLEENDYIAIMTNGHSHDFEVQEQVLRKEYAYVGVIGSRSKTASVNQRLMAAGISEAACQSVHTPIGTKIKAVTPEEIAVSIAGEMIYVRAVRREGAEDIHHHCPMH